MHGWWLLSDFTFKWFFQWWTDISNNIKKPLQTKALWWIVCGKPLKRPWPKLWEVSAEETSLNDLVYGINFTNSQLFSKFDVCPAAQQQLDKVFAASSQYFDLGTEGLIWRRNREETLLQSNHHNHASNRNCLKWINQEKVYIRSIVLPQFRRILPDCDL